MDQLRDLVYTLMNIMGDTLKQKILMRFHPVLRDSKPRVCRLGSSLAGFLCAVDHTMLLFTYLRRIFGMNKNSCSVTRSAHKALFLANEIFYLPRFLYGT